MQEYDLIIVGGGLIGGSLACALAGSGLGIALVEAVAADAPAQPSYDERVLALSWGSRRIFEGIGLWDAMAAESEPILTVHVSERGHCGFARLDHLDLGVEALGYVAPARAMGAAIRARLGTPAAPAGGIDFICPARVDAWRVEGDRVEVDVLTRGRSMRLAARLLVAADGGDSAIRRGLDVPIEERTYGHHAVIATVMPDRPLPGHAYERFTESGPLAMLPMTEGRYSVVWTCLDAEVPALLALSDQGFLARLQDRFGYRLGRLGQPSLRRAYPLKLVLARETVAPRLVLIGNAAHTLHPVAGQGFNLGLRDVAALAEVLTASPRALADPGAPAVLAAYRDWRGQDQRSVANFTDALARLFTNPLAPLQWARNAGLVGLDLLPPARHALARRFMGVGARMPRLARGLPLLPSGGM